MGDSDQGRPGATTGSRAQFGQGKTIWTCHARFSNDGAWDEVHAALLAEADAVGGIDWAVSADHAIGRSQARMCTKIRYLGDGVG